MLVAPLAILALLAGCNSPSSERSNSSAPTTPLAETGASHCSSGRLGAAFGPDANFSGNISPSDYSQSADVQAALLYDQYQSGYRQVLTTLRPSATPGTSPSAAPTKPSAPEQFASCVSMRFADEQGAIRFLGSYRDLRAQAGNLAQSTDPGKVASLTDLVAYSEQGQEFRAYGLTDAHVIELAGRSGSRLFIATVAGAAPTIEHARALAAAMVSG